MWSERLSDSSEISRAVRLTVPLVSREEIRWLAPFIFGVSDLIPPIDPLRMETKGRFRFSRMSTRMPFLSLNSTAVFGAGRAGLGLRGASTASVTHCDRRSFGQLSSLEWQKEKLMRSGMK